MLPFLKKPPAAGLVEVIHRKPDENQEDMNDDQGLVVVAEELCRALERKDYKAISEALKSAFEIMDASPHREGPHIEDENEE